MFSWITGPRITNVIEDLQSDPAFDSTFIEPPDTPAPQFAVKAFRQALFGTPAPVEAKQAKKIEKKTKPDATNKNTPEFSPPKESLPPVSPSKGILATPGTSKGRKTVSFGSQVVDNEGKGKVGKSGIPSNCPGKFPSPWTPGTELKLDVASDSKPRTKLTEALYDARTTAQPKSGQKIKARDDSDITLDLGAPRSDSGKYWKEQYEVYAKRSEKEMKQLVTKQQLAKNFAKKKDDEATSLTNQRDEERIRFRKRERELEQQLKELQEHLRKATSEKNAADMTNAVLKKRIEQLEKPAALEIHSSKMPFEIFEDLSKDSSHMLLGQGKAPHVRTRKTPEPSIILPARLASESSAPPENKENSPPKARRARRQTLPDHSSRPTPSRASININNRSDDSAFLANLLEPVDAPLTRRATSTLDAAPAAPVSIRKPEPGKENISTKSANTLPSSPLPLPSPEQSRDPWLDFDNSPLPQKKDILDLMAVPISSGPTHSRFNASNTTTTTRSNRAARQKTTHSNVETSKTKPSIPSNTDTQHIPSRQPPKTDISRSEKPSFIDDKFDISKSTIHHAAESSIIRREREKGSLPVDRKEEAKRRLLERKMRKGTGV